MRVTIRGARYDTSTATWVAERFIPGGTYWLKEALYQSPRGRYFLCGQGGPESYWGAWRTTGDRMEGAGIRPLTPEAAKRWLARHARHAKKSKT